MITRLNLASKPFTNRVLPWAVAAVVVLSSLVALVFITRANAEANRQAATVQRDINVLNEQQRQLIKNQEQLGHEMPLEQQQVLKSAHQLVDRKRFSWSRLFADLEGVLPQSVRVARIAVRDVHSQGNHTVANLELVVIAKSFDAVKDMMAVMDREGIFHAELSVQNLQKGRGESGSEYELNLQYSPRAGFASSGDARAALEPPASKYGGAQ